MRPPSSSAWGLRVFSLIALFVALVLSQQSILLRLLAIMGGCASIYLSDSRASSGIKYLCLSLKHRRVFCTRTGQVLEDVISAALYRFCESLAVGNAEHVSSKGNSPQVVLCCNVCNQINPNQDLPFWPSDSEDTNDEHSVAQQ